MPTTEAFIVAKLYDNDWSCCRRGQMARPLALLPRLTFIWAESSYVRSGGVLVGVGSRCQECQHAKAKLFVLVDASRLIFDFSSLKGRGLDEQRFNDGSLSSSLSFFTKLKFITYPILATFKLPTNRSA